MSTITGQAPIIDYLMNPTASSFNLTDGAIVNQLLNNTASYGYSNYTTLATNQFNGLVMSTPANKSMYVFQNINITNTLTNVTQANITTTSYADSFVDVFGVDVTASNILLGESLRFCINTQDRENVTGAPVVYSSNTTGDAQIVLKEVAPNTTDQMIALNNLRMLNSTNLLVVNSLTYNSNNVTNALGVEGKAFYYNGTNSFEPNFKNYTGYETLATNNITLSVAALTNTNSYNYEVVKSSTGDAYFNFTSNQVSSSVKYSTDGTNLTALNANVSTSYTGFVGALNYSGTMAANYQTVYTSNLTLSLTNGVNVTQGLSGGNAYLVVNPTFVAMNNITSVSQANSLVIADTINVTLTAYGANWTGVTSSLPTNSLTITQANEVLPAGHTSDNATLSFNSTNRTTITNQNSYTISTNIVYSADNVTSSQYYLSDANMTNQVVNYTLKMTSGDTLNNLITYNANPDNNQWTNCSGVNFFVANQSYNNTAVEAVTCSNPASSSFVGAIQQTVTCVWGINPDGGYSANSLLAVDSGSFAAFNLTVSSYYGNLTGASITGTYLCDYIRTTIPNIDPSQQRIRFVANDPLSLSVTGSVPLNITNNTTGSITLTSNITAYLAGASVTYNSNATFGPITYKDFPNTTNYYQRYVVQFPETGEVNANSAEPEKILISALDGAMCCLTNSMTNTQVAIVNLGVNNWVGRSVSTDLGTGITTVTGTLRTDIALSGIQSGSINLDIPIQYQYNSRNRAWIGGVRPQLSFDIQFNKNNLLTHHIQIEGYQTTTSTWINYANPPSQTPSQPPYDYVDLRRSPYDACFFNYSIGAIQQYNAVLSFYPTLAQSFYNTDYYIPLVEVTDPSTGGASAVIAIIDGNQTLIDYIGAKGYQALGTTALADIVNNSGVTFNSMTVTLLNAPSDPEYPKRLRLTYGSISFDYTITNGAYFGPTQKSYFINLVSPIIQSVGPSYNPISPTPYQLMANNTQYAIDNGVNVQSSTFVGVNSGANIATFSLNVDKYTASVYNGGIVATNANIPTNLLLIDGSTPSPYTTFQLSSAFYRGFANDITYTIARSNSSYEASFGSYTQSGSLFPAGANPTDLSLNFTGSGHNFQFTLQLIANPLTVQNINFTVNKTHVTGTWQLGSNPAQTATSSTYTSLRMADILSGLGGVAPYYELLFMNNSFVVGTNSDVVQYIQPNVLVEAFANNYYSTNNSTPADTFLNALSSATTSNSYSDADIVSAGYVLTQDQVSMTYNSSYMNRPVGKTYYVTVAPMSVKVTHRLTQNPANNVVGYVLLDSSSQSYDVEVGSSTYLARYTLDLINNFYVYSLKSSSAASDLIYKPNLFSLQGKLTSDSWATGYYYFQDVDIVQAIATSQPGWAKVGNNYRYTEQQQSTPTSFFTLFWNDPFTRGVFNNDGFNYACSQQLEISPQSASQMTQYELGFTFNTSNILVPIVTKYTSAVFSNSVNLTLAGQPNGWSVNPQTSSGEILYLNTTATSSIDPSTKGFAYEYVSANNYPKLNNQNVTIINTTNIAYASLPWHLDIVMNVKNGNGVTGSIAWNNFINISAGDVNTIKVLKVYAKDQLVVKDYVSNLSFRVGPNGQAYAGDLTSYSLTLNDYNINNITANGNFVPVYNSDVNLQGNLA